MKRQLLTVLCGLVSSTLIAAERPNVLLIVADDLGWADVGWHGGFGRTPHMDRPDERPTADVRPAHPGDPRKPDARELSFPSPRFPHGTGE